MSWTASWSQAQQSAYFILGEDQFNGLEVYDVIQDGKDNYLFSTNEGLFYYDFLHFEPIGCALAKSASMFNFVADPSGNIYCSNINHQIFRIQGGDCQLFYELLPDEDSPDVSLIWTKDNELLACSKKIIRLGPDGAVRERSAMLPDHNLWGRPFEAPDGNILFHCPGTDSLLIYRDKSFSYQRMGMGFPLTDPTMVFNFFAVDKTLYAVLETTKKVYELEPVTYQTKEMPAKYNADRSKSLRIYQTGNSTWLAGTLRGAVHLDAKLGTRIPEVFYSKYFISDVFQDREGNVLLSTFDQGILVIPDLQIPDVIQAAGDDPITALYVDPQEQGLYLGSSKGKLVRYLDGQFETLFDNGLRPIKGIYGARNSSKVIFDPYGVCTRLGNGKIQSLDIVAALKAAVFLNENLAYLGTSQGIFRCEWLPNGKLDLYLLPDFSFRIHHLVLDSARNALVASTARGLYYIPVTGAYHKITVAGLDLYPTALYAGEAGVYAATKSEGILVLEAGKITGQIQLEISKMEAISKLVVDEGRIFAKSSHGIYQFGPQGDLQRNIGKTFGFLKARVFDFALAGNVLWVSHAGGVQAIDLAFSKGAQVPASLRIARVTVNDQAVPSDQTHSFSAAERKIKFELASPSLRNRESLRIHYQLEGFDKDWIVKPSGESAIVYNALAPGKYRFLAKAENQGQFSAAVSYSFAIPAPIYTQWWFSAACILFIASIVGAIYRRQSTIQHRKAQQLNELNASKLAAIQSQMNPHFIFNAMNSIQDLILKGDIENSYSYVTTFSNLVRSTLKYSEKDFIDFEQELELLRLYLSLEKLRFEEELEYSIINLVDDDIQLPPLLIQPFVENALLHGLLHKEGIKKLVIRFELLEALICTIEDNGIGRQRAMEIRERQRGEHESFSGKAIRKRFDILSDVHQGEFGYVHEDLTEDGLAVGTRIILQIPVRRRF